MAAPRIERHKDGTRKYPSLEHPERLEGYERAAVICGAGGLVGISIFQIGRYLAPPIVLVLSMFGACGFFILGLLIFGIGALIDKHKTQKFKMEELEWEKFMKASKMYRERKIEWDNLGAKIDVWAEQIKKLESLPNGASLSQADRDAIHAVLQQQNIVAQIKTDTSPTDIKRIVDCMKVKLKDMMAEEAEGLKQMQEAFKAWKAAGQPSLWPPSDSKLRTAILHPGSQVGFHAVNGGYTDNKKGGFVKPEKGNDNNEMYKEVDDSSKVTYTP